MRSLISIEMEIICQMAIGIDLIDYNNKTNNVEVVFSTFSQKPRIVLMAIITIIVTRDLIL